MQKHICLPLLLCALTGFAAAQPLPKSIKPWINDEKIRDSIDDAIEHDELAIEIGKILEDAPQTCTLKIPSKRYASATNLYQFCSPSIVIISRSGYCKRCDKIHGRASGTGFFVSDNGAIATNYHLVDHDDGTYFVTTFDGKTYPVTKLLAANKRDDLAILQIEPKEPTAFTPLPLVNQAPVGMPVWVISHPDHRFFTMTDGIISRYREMEPKKRNNFIRHSMMITAPFSPGSSGGPVLDKNGNVVGIARAREAVGRSKHAEHEHPDIPAQIAHLCIPVEQLVRMIKRDQSY